MGRQTATKIMAGMAIAKVPITKPNSPSMRQAPAMMAIAKASRALAVA